MRERPLMPPPVWALLFVTCMVAAARLFPQTRIAFPGQAALAYALLGAGVAVGASAVLSFRRHRTTVHPMRPDEASTLVTTGVFSVTRNPMYLGLALVVAGVGLRTGSLIALSLAPVFVVALTKFQIEPEEAAMRRLFGEAWGDYAARVPRWLLV